MAKAKARGHDVLVELSMNPGDPRNAIYIDGKKLAMVTKVEIVGEARRFPRVCFTLIPNVLTAKLGKFSSITYRRPTKHV